VIVTPSGKVHNTVATTLNNLAGLYSDQKRYKKAESMLIQALDIKKQIFGNDHPSTAISLNNLANLYADMGCNDKAIPLFKQALAMFDHHLGIDHPTTIFVRESWMTFQSNIKMKVIKKKKGKSNMKTLQEL
jgi:tetratricopeptide (TPR) repeat protein